MSSNRYKVKCGSYNILFKFGPYPASFYPFSSFLRIDGTRYNHTTLPTKVHCHRSRKSRIMIRESLSRWDQMTNQRYDNKS